jgi:RND family efflux transporter MFP subunit
MSRELIERAGIRLTTVGRGVSTGGLRAPGVIEPNAYKSVKVTPTAGGRIVRVSAELGERVRRGQVLAQIYSSELADAQARYVTASAELDAHEREVTRTEKLGEIGAASRQELERIHAEHAQRRAALQSAASQLRLLGASEPAPGATKLPEPTIAVPAPLDGVVTERIANVGLNVQKDETLFTVVDLSTLWVVADIFEKDFSRVRVGTNVTVTTAAYPGLELKARVSYIDPQVDASTRTAKARIEVPNADQGLRLGMLVEAQFEASAGDAPEIPRSAVQNVGDRSVVYLAKSDPPTEFVEREVRLGATSADRVQVLGGLNTGDKIVSEGSFSVRAERERLGLRSPTLTQAPAGTASSEDTQTAKVIVSDQGFEPSHLALRKGIRARVSFIRTSDKTCATEIQFPSMNIKKALPLNEEVVVEFVPSVGEIAFACGMNMFKGTIVAR